MHKTGLKWVGILIMLGLVLTSWPVPTVSAETPIVGNVTWDVDQYPQSDVVIKDGATLTIASGVRVYFSCTEHGDYTGYSYDPSRVEIIVESGGRLEVDGAGLVATDLFTDSCWYGVEFRPGSSGFIKNSTVQNAVVGVTLESDAEISHNSIVYMEGVDADSSLSDGGTVMGIKVNTPGLSPTIMENHIESIFGGNGWDGGWGEAASNGGDAYGIYVEAGYPRILGNVLQYIDGGNGGRGGDGLEGVDGQNGTVPGENGGNGQLGEAAMPGGDGGDSIGIYLGSDADDTFIGGSDMLYSNGGTGGTGGMGGSGGAGGDGAPAATGESAGNGGNGGVGYNGEVGGRGGDAVGIFVAADSVQVFNSMMYNLTGGSGGFGGSGGNGGDGGVGGLGSTESVGVGGTGGSGGTGGQGGVPGDGGRGGDCYLVYVDQGSFEDFDSVLLRYSSSGYGGYGARGGVGGPGGNGGPGGTGPEATGPGGAGGDGGNGGLASQGGESGVMYGIFVDGDFDPMIFTNNIFINLSTIAGGYGGEGGPGGAGGNGGVGTPAGIGGDGGDAGNGGNGGSTLNAYLMQLNDASAIIVNNTMVNPYGGGNVSGGYAGTPGYGGTGSVQGADGADAIGGEEGSSGSSIGMEVTKSSPLPGGSITFSNNIMSAENQPNSIAIVQGENNPNLTISYNDFWRWAVIFSPSGDYDMHDNLEVDPQYQDPYFYNFRLESSSPCIDGGTNSAPVIPPNDFDGSMRPQDGDNNGSVIVDIGAFELMSEGTPTSESYIPCFLR